MRPAPPHHLPHLTSSGKNKQTNKNTHIGDRKQSVGISLINFIEKMNCFEVRTPSRECLCVRLNSLRLSAEKRKSMASGAE
jgi:hypothetical protein